MLCNLITCKPFPSPHSTLNTEAGFPATILCQRTNGSFKLWTSVAVRMISALLSPCSTTRRQCWSERTWRRWSRYPCWDPELWQAKNPRYLGRPCWSWGSRAWWRMECLWWCGGWWIISASTVKGQKKWRMFIIRVQCSVFYISLKKIVYLQESAILMQTVQ